LAGRSRSLDVEHLNRPHWPGKAGCRERLTDLLERLVNPADVVQITISVPTVVPENVEADQG
jgi:hypothetical protein